MTDDVSSEERGKPKSLSLTPAISALIMPTAEYLGTELRDLVKDSIEDWKRERRENNLNAHVQAVKEQLSDQPPPETASSPSLKQLSFFEEWMSGVQDVDPEDEELSSIWRDLLAKAARGQSCSSEVIEALKSLSPSEAKFLVEMRSRTPTVPLFRGTIRSEDRFLAKTLESRNILEKDYAFAGFFASSLGLSVVFLYYFTEKIGMPTEFPIIGGFLATLVAASAVSLRSGLGRWRLTWLGKQLVYTSKPARKGS
ncbi:MULTISPECIES: hypothetical protein [Halomonadaceae]|uniref:hypothetical protein n=1 Tax=Halomonadaceae TaxID=28256 RepID=UPI0015832F2A|nr:MULTISPECIES: hypothetical protein [Halomonas]MDI4636932.1 hypothetical protein [Halomonas sp. BMC7]NUJ58099.1 hypothetical protein [Halomonas taeanensis]